MLKNLTLNFLYHVLTLFNLFHSQGMTSKIWKHAFVTMIPKGSRIANDPNNYRAISLISCLSKLLDRIVCLRLSDILESSGVMQ